MQEWVLVRQFFWRKLARLNFNIVLKIGEMQEWVLVRQFFWRKLARLNFNIVLKIGEMQEWVLVRHGRNFISKNFLVIPDFLYLQ